MFKDLFIIFVAIVSFATLLFATSSNRISHFKS